ncbi:uncharacterized protein LOC123783588 isoform X1 [Ursus americanus]|uniref:uncharacterized protein LOC123783588 isoform X1 n=1 Tax=Ursus americanus TaxID=9643 RepID=UPI001E67DAF6|nr:uncharacterized protein LOC123783588 isoform X1 [Ursus americanus]
MSRSASHHRGDWNVIPGTLGSRSMSQRLPTRGMVECSYGHASPAAPPRDVASVFPCSRLRSTSRAVPGTDRSFINTSGTRGSLDTSVHNSSDETRVHPRLRSTRGHGTAGVLSLYHESRGLIRGKFSKKNPFRLQTRHSENKSIWDRSREGGVGTHSGIRNARERQGMSCRAVRTRGSAQRTCLCGHAGLTWHRVAGGGEGCRLPAGLSISQPCPLPPRPGLIGAASECS